MIKPINKGITSKGSQRYLCLVCKHSFTDTFDTLYYRRQLKPEEVHTIVQSHCEGSSLRGVARSSGRADGTVVALVCSTSQKAQMIHNAFVQQVKSITITADELWSFIQKTKNTVCLGNSRWAIAELALSQAKDSGLILSARVGKHTDKLSEELVTSTQGKTDCQFWDTGDILLRQPFG